MRKLAALLLALCLLCPGLALAETEETGDLDFSDLLNALRFAPGEKGIRSCAVTVYYRGDHNASLICFLEETPAELDGAFAPFRAKGWEGLTGGYLRFDTPTNDREPENQISGMGLVILGQGERRLTCIVDCRAGAWELWPLGEDCLLPGALPAISLDTLHLTRFRLTWALSPEKELRMTVLPSVAARKEEGYVEAVCHIEDCTVVDLSGGGALYPALPHHYLGAADMSRLSLTVTDDETQAQPSLIPEGYVMAGGVHLRADHSSHSEDLGLLNRGVLLPVLDVTDGTEYPWIRTQLGPLKGYVSANYTSYQEWGISDPADVAPIPVAEARQPLSLYGDKGFLGTGFLAPAVAELPAGARMYVLIFSGDWLFVAAPRAELGWFMDPDSDFGWVRASEVRLASMAAQLDWLE